MLLRVKYPSIACRPAFWTPARRGHDQPVAHRIPIGTASRPAGDLCVAAPVAIAPCLSRPKAAWTFRPRPAHALWSYLSVENTLCPSAPPPLSYVSIVARTEHPPPGCARRHTIDAAPERPTSLSITYLAPSFIRICSARAARTLWSTPLRTPPALNALWPARVFRCIKWRIFILFFC